MLTAVKVEPDILSLATYQAATFLFAIGRCRDALPLSELSLSAADQAFKPHHEQVLREPL